MEYIITREEYQTLKATWKQTTRSPEEHIIYNVLRGKPLVNGFCGNFHNTQGNDPWYAFKQAKRYAANYLRPERAETFKKLFGITAPEGLLERIK